MVPHDEADGRGPAFQVQGRDPGRMRHRRHFAEYPGLPLLLQGRAGLEHLPGTEKCRGEGRADVFWVVERMVARSVAADRGGAAHRRQADGKSGIEAAWFFIA